MMAKTESGQDWKQTAERLQEKGNVPKRRAQVVALRDAGRSLSEIRDELGLSNRSNVSVHLKRYREDDLAAAEWLVEEGPTVKKGEQKG
jgi:DNA-binding transcriptional ArsR family regulator